MVTNCLIVWLNYHKKWNNVYKWFLNILITQSISLLMQSSYQLIPLPPPTPYEFHWLLFPLSFHSLFNFVSSDVEWEWLIILNCSYLQNVVFDSNYWPYSQILISCLPTNCGMSLKLISLVPNYLSDITYVENAGRVITAGFHMTAKMSL